MKKILITLAIAMTSVAAVMAADWLPGLNPDTKYVYCRCHKLYNQDCSSFTQTGTVCAAGYVNCDDYDLNCPKKQ